MKNITLLTFFVLCNFLYVNSQTSTIKGKITLKDSTTSVTGVSIYLYNTKYKTISNSNGFFVFNNIPFGNYKLIIENIGYKKISKNIIINNSKSLYFNFYLRENIESLSVINVGIGGKNNLKNMSGSVNYISEKELEKNGYTDVNKILKSIPGVNLQEEDGFGLRPNIGLRGTGVERSSKITIMEDGVLIAPAPYIAPSAYYFPTIGRMQGVEIMKGSSQIKYGPYTTGGSINLISSQIPNEFSGKINLTTGSFGSKVLHTNIGTSYTNIGFFVETFQYKADGFKELQTGGNTGFNKSDYLIKLRLNTSKKRTIYQSINFKVGQTSEQSNETYLGLTENDFYINPYLRYAGSDIDNMQALHHQFSATHLIKFSKRINIITTVYYTNFKRNWYKLDKVKDSSNIKLKIKEILDNPVKNKSYFNILNGNKNNINNTLFIKANNRSYYAKGVQSVGVYKFIKKNVFHKFELGLRVHQDQIDRFQWVDEYIINNILKLNKKGIAGSESNRVETANALASYLTYKIKFKKWSFLPGIRYENIQMYRLDYGNSDVNRIGKDLKYRQNAIQIFIPGASLNYKINKYYNIYTGIHKGFAPPGTKKGTIAEQSINYEVGNRYNKKSVFIDAVLFFNDYSNLLGSDIEASGGQGTNALFNGGEVNTFGVELLCGFDILSLFNKSKFNLPFSVNYTYTNAVFKTSFKSDFDGWGNVKAGDYYPYLAQHQFNIQMQLQHKYFNFNLNSNYQSKMRIIPSKENTNNKNSINDFFTLNSSININLHQNIVLFGSVTNLTNNIYVVAKRPAGLRPGMPRAFNIGLKAKF